MFDKIADKIEDFLFDFLGLALPGFIFLLIYIGVPIIFINFENVNDSSTIVKILSYIIKDLKIENIFSYKYIILIIIISYIIGHTIKVFSKYQYYLCVGIFDKGINEFIKCISGSIDIKNYRLILLLKNKVENNVACYSSLINIIKNISNFILKIISDIFCFKPPDYYEVNHEIKTKVVKKINQKWKIKFPDNWYSIYKVSSIINAQENIKSLSTTFLAKYNMYRSLAFIFFINFFYLLFIFGFLKKDTNIEAQNMCFIPITLNFILWLTFHEKFKRYWTLCGNESLMSLFYFLQKNNQSEEKKPRKSRK